MDGKTALGASSPAKPALHIPEPLSTTRAATSSSHILVCWFFNKNKNETKVCVFNGRWLTSEPRYARYLYNITFCPNVCLTQATLLCHEPKHFLGYKVATCASLSCKHARGQGSIRLSNHIFLGWQPYLQCVSKNISKSIKLRIIQLNIMTDILNKITNIALVGHIYLFIRIYLQLHMYIIGWKCSEHMEFAVSVTQEKMGRRTCK